MGEKIIMKGFKGFEPNLICRGKQYAENTVFTEDTAEICNSGMHFCESPFDVFGYYPPVTDGKFNEFTTVEALDECKTDDDKKFCTKKLKIGAKLSFGEFIKAGIDFNLSKVNFEPTESATGYYSGASATGDRSGASATGNRSGASATGDYSGASATGYRSGASATGYRSGASATGDRSGASATGYRSGASATGDYSGASATGNRSGASATGDYSGASATGNRSGAMVVGNDCKADVKNNSVAMVVGSDGKAKGEIGCFIVLTETARDTDGNIYIKDVQAVKVDGKTIKSDTYYTLKNGKFRKVKEEA